MQKLQLFIPEPCHENWQTMTATEQGRFCNSCAKEVVDFSMMTDTEVLNYFTALTHEKVCGRALPTQLNRNIVRPKEPRKRLFWYWNYIVMVFMFFSKNNTAKAQVGIKPITEFSPAKQVDNDYSQDRIQGDTVISNSVVSGKVTDIDGNPVSFATIKIKGSVYGISADANGGYSVKVRPNDILLVSAASFQKTEIAIGTQSMINIILNKGYASGLMEIVVDAEIGLKHVAILTVKDDESFFPLSNVKIIIAKRSSNLIDTSVTDKKGIYRLKGLKENEEYFIKIVAEGYGVSVFTIDVNDFRSRKKEWEILLSKQKHEPVKYGGVTNDSRKLRILGGAVSIIIPSGPPIYIVDGIILPDGIKIDSADIETRSVFEGPAASAIFGPQGANGAIVITTRKAKEKSLDTVIVSSPPVCIKSRVTGTMSAKSISESYNDKKTDVIKGLNNKLRFYPNPALRGNIINITLMLKQTGLLNISITDVSGRIVLQKQVNALSKEQNEQIMCEHKWSAGIYYISVFDNQNKLITKTNFIVQ